VIPAVVASVGGAARNAVMLPLYFTLRAGGNAVWPTLLFDVLKAGIIVRKFRIELIQRILLRFVQAIVSALDIAHVIIMGL